MPEPRTAAATVPDARAVAETVTDPELPMLTLHDLGVLRDVAVTESGAVEVSITPTYSGCPAMREMCSDLTERLRAVGYSDVRVRTVLHPPWTTDWITERGRRALAEHGIAPPGAAPSRGPGLVPLTLLPCVASVPCPRCGSGDPELISQFGSTSCKRLLRCRSCGEPFEHLKVT